MKWTIFIVAVLLLLQSLKPCSDAFNEDHKDDVAIENNHNHSDDFDDSCSSLCICTCCGIAITFIPLERFKMNEIIVNSSEERTSYYSKYTFNTLSNIWQPPKLII